jgi:hypothetical protein
MSKHTTWFHLVYCVDGGEFKPYGLFETHAQAEEEIASIGRSTDWKICPVLCIGFGIVDDRLGRNQPEKRPQ